MLGVVASPTFPSTSVGSDDSVTSFDPPELFPPLQLIQADGTLTEELSSYIDQRQLRRLGTRYNVCSILGGQSSGKSTLLNAVFHTTFETMDWEEAPNQTTQGIWIAKSPEMDYFVLDVEGADSLERDGDLIFERRAALYALLMSDVLLLNIRYNDTGRRNASCNSLMKIVLREQAELFIQNATELRKTRLIFCIRDWHDGRCTIDAYTDKLHKDFRKLWEEVARTSRALSGKNLVDLFSIEVVPFRDKLNAPARFEEDASAFRHRISNDNPQYSRAIPVDALPPFAQRMWELTEGPNMLAIERESGFVKALMCGKYAQEALEKAKEKISRICKATLSAEAWEKQIYLIVDKALTFYSLRTETYTEIDKGNKREEVFRNVCGELEDIFAIYLSQLISVEGNVEVSSKWTSIDLENCTAEQFEAIHQDWEEHMREEIAASSIFRWNLPGIADNSLVQLEHKFNFDKYAEDIDRQMSECWAKILNRISQDFYERLRSATQTRLNDLWQESKMIALPAQIEYTQILLRSYDEWHKCPATIVLDAIKTRTDLKVRESNDDNIKCLIIYVFRHELRQLVHELPTQIRLNFEKEFDDLAKTLSSDRLHVQALDLKHRHIQAFLDIHDFCAIYRTFHDVSDQDDFAALVQDTGITNMQLNILTKALDDVTRVGVQAKKDAENFPWECVKNVAIVGSAVGGALLLRR